MYKQVTALTLFAAGVSAHGHLASPTPRPLGDAMKAACGQQVWNMMSSDMNGNVQTMAQVGTSQSDFDAAACHLSQCRGYQFDDATADTIQSFAAGEVVPITITIAAPHTGVANVSVINLATNSVIGAPLISFENYASTATGISADQTSFSVTMPDSLDAACATAGGCALQWWWDAREIDQTYMSCVDFAFTGASSGGGGGDSSTTPPDDPAEDPAAPATTPAATTSAPASLPTGTNDDEADGCETNNARRRARRARLTRAAARRG